VGGGKKKANTILFITVASQLEQAFMEDIKKGKTSFEALGKFWGVLLAGGVPQYLFR